MALALLDEADRDRVGDPVRRRLVGVENPAEEREVAIVLLERGWGRDVAQREHDADHAVGLDATGDDPFG